MLIVHIPPVTCCGGWVDDFEDDGVGTSFLPRSLVGGFFTKRFNKDS